MPTTSLEFNEAVERRAKGEPVAYIRGIKEFYGLALSVDARALIPRPETELLVELGLSRLRYMLTERPRPRTGEPLLVWDVGTGSGAIVVALAVEARRRGYARDVLFSERRTCPRMRSPWPRSTRSLTVSPTRSSSPSPT